MSDKWKLLITERAKKDLERAFETGQKKNVNALLDLIEENPFAPYPPYEKLRGDLNGAYSRRINIQHRLVYEVSEELHAVKIISLWSHYE